MRSASAVLVVAFLVACQSGASAGTSCARDADCSSPLVCRLGRCRSACVENRDCPIGAQCFLGPGGGACELEVDHRCGATTACGAGLTCLSGQCVHACTGASDCPTDGSCAIGSGSTIGLCVDPRSNDAGAGDAGDAGAATCRSVEQVCVGNTGYVCARLDDGSIACWGYDASHETGSAASGETCGTAPCRLHPARVVDAGGAVVRANQLACGGDHACVITTDARVMCWGTAYNDMRGNGDLVPMPNADESFFDERGRIGWGQLTAPRAMQVAIGRYHSCVVADDARTVRCWGDNVHGQLGLGRSSPSEMPSAPTALVSGRTPPLATILTGDGFTCATDTSGGVACIGFNLAGQLGPTLAIGVDAITAPVDPMLGSTSIVVGDSTLCALGSTGVVRCAGANDRGQLGRDTGGADTNMPAPVAGTTTFDAIWSQLDSNATFARSGMHVFAWGNNLHDVTAIDNNVEQIRATPELVSAIGPAAEIATNGDTACARTANGSLSCWGANEAGQLGRGTPGPDDPTPMSVCIALP